MNNKLLKNDINRMIKYYTEELNKTKSDNIKDLLWFQAKIEAYREVLEMVNGYEKTKEE